ncbi:MAG: ubiquitin-conjugating enzyme E2 [Candidatus Hodarchaeales archaeon]|jgi:ubiquitin-conjugating enzyme E2 Z
MSSKTEFMPPKNQKRLLRDVARMIKNPLTDNGIYYVHDSENMLKGYALVFGPDDSLYRYGSYMFEFTYPTDYPFVPPKVTYLTNDGTTRFNPNLYRNGKVCISLLNTWKGEQWTSCQTIKSILLSLVSLLHNEPLLNEPGINKNHRDFKPYNSIIQYKNYEVAILGVLRGTILPSNFIAFMTIIKQYISKKKNIILEELQHLIDSKQDKKEFRTNIYSMKVLTDYSNLKSKLTLAFDEYL